MFYNFAYVLVRFVMFFIWRIKVTGRENIPSGPALVCANHTNFGDPILVAIGLGISVHPAFMAKAELFSNKPFAAALRAVGAFPVRRGKGDVSAIKGSLAALKRGQKLILFPEGTRMSESKKAELRTGAGMLALRSGAQILPVYVTTRKQWLAKVHVVIGTPYTPEWDGKPGHDAYVAVVSDIMRRVEEIGKTAGKTVEA